MRKCVEHFKQHVKRPSLLWMSRQDILKVRNQLICLFKHKDESFRVAAPKNVFIKDVLITTNHHPLFEHAKISRDGYYIGQYYQFWLKVPKFKNPYWDYIELNEEGPTDIDSVPFDHPIASIPALLIKKYLDHFPFSPTDNFLLNNGEPIV